MSSQDDGWNVVHSLYETLGIDREGYFGGEVILAPFDVATLAHIPKTVYGFNPIFFVCESFEQMDALLAVNQAVKALALAKGYLREDGYEVVFSPEFVDVEIDGKIRTAIKFIVEQR